MKMKEVMEDINDNYECEDCGVLVKGEHWGLSYGALSMSFCKDCYERNWAEHPDNPTKEEDEEFDTDICYKCDKEFEKDDTGEWGCTNIRMSSGRLEGIVFCHDCWEDEVANCETDEEGDSVWKGE